MRKQALNIILVLSLAALAACNKNGGGYDNGQFGSAAVGDRVLFGVDQSSLSDEARVILDAQASWLMENSEYVAVVEGHADEQGTREYNLALGARRANAVKEYLVSLGVAGSRLKTVSYGKERPLEICSAERCYEKNRRAVSVLDNLNF
ncbi:MAG: peptidoglycan-associated lipoprotein Pal [Rhodobacteraceae bacterium]|nr:peptidoglycan-associated lipoprotein Pal [Paracoccaceae bacterium]